MKSLVKILRKLSSKFECDSDTKSLIEEKIQSLLDENTGLTITQQSLAAELIALFLKHGADVNAKDDENNAPLHKAVQRGDLFATHILVENGAEINTKNRCWDRYYNEWLNENDMPLHLAVENDDLLITMYLVYRGADINARSRQNGTPLHIAIRRKNMSILKWLVCNKADMNIVNMKNLPPLIFAYNDANKDMEIVKYLIENGAYINSSDGNGWTFLLLASQTGDIEFLKYLIHKGANVNAIALFGGITALTLAIQKKNVEVIKYLVDKGANVNGIDGFVNEVPLHLVFKWF